MAKFPVENGDKEGIIEAVNYVLSGPSGLGQNFSGFSAYLPGWLTGNFRVPYSQNTVATLYVPPIDLATSEMLDGRTWKFTFATPQSAPPFALGNGVVVRGVNSLYNGGYVTIGVVQCTTTSVTARTTTTYTVEPSASGGTIELTTGTGFNSTDCNARVTVSGGTDRVFISAQIASTIQYIIDSAPATLTYTVSVNRYIGGPSGDPINPDYRFGFDETVAEKTYTRSDLTGTGTLAEIETVFTTVLDQPAPGYYWYILELTFNFTSGSGEVVTNQTGLRSLSAQVVKQ
jgi:hypothetical protein